MRSIIIFGAGGHGQVVADILINRKNYFSDSFPLGYLDDNSNLKGKKYIGLEVLGTSEDIEKIDHDEMIVGIGDNEVRFEKINRFLQIGEKFANAIHPKTTIAPDVVLGVGNMCCAGVIINTGSVIKDNVILNTGATIDHHNFIESHVHIAPGVHLGGNVKVGQGTLIGIGSTVIPGIEIGEYSIIGAGSVVTKNIPSYCTAIGVPARVIKHP